MTGKQLKNSILQLAIQGKLVPQNPDDEPASALLARIRKEKEELVKGGKLKKKDLATTPISDEEKPFEIPESWEWCRLGEIASFVVDCPHSTPQKVNYETNYPCIRTSEIKGGKIQWDSMQYLDESNYSIRIARLKPIEGDIVYAREGAYGDAVLLPATHNFCLGQRTMMLRMAIRDIAEYVHQAIISPFVYSQAVSLNREGTTSVGHVNMSDIVNFIIPLPPLSEQHRIVAKIEELMPLVEEYDKAQTKLDALNQKLPEALKKSIQQEAIMGKLVPQDPKDEPASVLLARIRKEKEQLVKDGKLKKKDLVTTPISDEEKPFEIPKSWEWCRWGELSFNIQYGYNAPALPSGDIRMVRISDIQKGEVLWDTVPFCNIKDDEIESYLLGNNDILFARTGGTVGKSFLVKEVPYPSIYAGYLIRTQYNSEVLVPEYLKMFMESDIYWRQLKDGTIATAQPNCNGKTLSKMVLPIPPLSEQHRIVAKIEELFAQLRLF